MRRRTLLLLIGSLVVVAAWAGWPVAEDHRPLRADAERESDDTGTDQLRADGEGLGSGATALEGRGSGLASTPPHRQPRDADDHDNSIQGTLVLVDKVGRESTVPKATLEFEITLAGGRIVTKHTDVIGGRWSMIVPPARTVLPCAVKIGTRTALFPDDQEPRPVAQGMTLSLRARFPRRSVLRVVDADTRVDLGNVRLVRLDWRMADNTHPGAYGPDCLVADGAASPIEIPTEEVDHWDTDVSFHAYSPGYSWGPVHIDLTTGGEYMVALRPGGSVDVQLTGEPPAKDMALHVRSAGGDSEGLVAEFDLAGATAIPIEGLTPGTYRLRVEIGDWFARPHVVAETTCVVVAGKRTRAVLNVPEVNRPEVVPLQGEVTVPESWQLRDFTLYVRLLDVALVAGNREERLSTNHGLARAAGRAGVWKFDAGLVQPGRYRLTVYGTGYSTNIRVGPSGDRRVRVNLPPAGVLSVRVVDASTGENADGVVVCWNSEFPEGFMTSSTQTVKQDQETKHFEFRAPLGRIHIRADSDDYFGESVAVQVVPGLTEVTLTVNPAGSLLVVLKDGEATFPGWPVWESKVTQIGGDGQVFQWGDCSGGVRLRLDQPGRYRIQFPPIPEYEPVPDQEVFVEVRKTARLEIRLERSR